MTSRTHIMLALLLVFVITASSIFWLYISDQTSREMQTEETPSKQSMSLTVIGPWAGSELDSFMPVLAEFEKSTAIDVNYKVYRADELATLLPAQFAAKKAPGDVIFMWCWFIKEQAKYGHILEVTDLIDKSDFLEGSLDVVEFEGKLYGAAYTGKVKPGFWYRKSFFRTHNLTEPKTWEDFVSLLETIEKIPGIKNPIVSGDEVGWSLSDVTEHFLITFGGTSLHQELMEGSVSWTDQKVVKIFDERLVPLLEDEYFSEPVKWSPTAINAWWEGEYALYFMGSWITGMVEDTEDLGVFSLPWCEGLVFVPDYFFVPEYSEHPDVAEEFFKYLAGWKGQMVQVAQGGHIATNLHVKLDSYPDIDKHVADLTLGKTALPDLDDAVGGEFQSTMWDQLKLFWVAPSKLNDVLESIEQAATQ